MVRVWCESVSNPRESRYGGVAMGHCPTPERASGAVLATGQCPATATDASAFSCDT